MYKTSGPGSLAPIGQDLVKMLESLAHRGKDSSGVTVAGQDLDEDLVIRIWTEDRPMAPEVFSRAEDTVLRAGGVIKSRRSWGDFLRLTVDYEGEIRSLAEALLDTDGVELHSVGEVSEVIKDVGTPVSMDDKHQISRLKGTHGIGHVRMATESRVDINHAHPFWAYPFPDVTVVHNGQLTNYHKLKRMYEDQGHLFQTGNDSELIAVYLADKLSRGETLDQALTDSLDDLDGTFTYLVSTTNGLGYAKDRWSAKPLVTMETDEVIAIASEEVALRSIFSQEIDRVEPQESEVMTWLL
jgi:glutamine phosphoribosylpyrophosphate amidotransferase